MVLNDHSKLYYISFGPISCKMVPSYKKPPSHLQYSMVSITVYSKLIPEVTIEKGIARIHAAEPDFELWAFDWLLGSRCDLVTIIGSAQWIPPRQLKTTALVLPALEACINTEIGVKPVRPIDNDRPRNMAALSFHITILLLCRAFTGPWCSVLDQSCRLDAASFYEKSKY